MIPNFQSTVLGHTTYTNASRLTNTWLNDDIRQSKHAWNTDISEVSLLQIIFAKKTVVGDDYRIHRKHCRLEACQV